MINRKTYLIPLMMMTAATISLSACDEGATTAENETVVETTQQTMVEEAPVVAAITASNATAFATADGATTGAVFLTLQNPGTEADVLIGVSTTLTPTVEIHESKVDETGVMTMSKLDGVDIAPSSTVELKAGGLHIMLMDLTTPLVEGSTFDVTLDFEKAADVVVPVTVTAAGVPMEGHEGHDMGTSEATPSDEGMMEETPSIDAPVQTDAQPSTDEIPAIIEETVPEATTDAPVTAPDETPAQ